MKISLNINQPIVTLPTFVLYFLDTNRAVKIIKRSEFIAWNGDLIRQIFITNIPYNLTSTFLTNIFDEII